jgi:4-hydroxybenzoate polyprenyltransferase
MAVLEVVEVALPRRRLWASVVSLRPKQWTKNVLVFAGIVFAARVGDGARWVEAVTVFVAYCAASSAAYLVNDVRDAELDRLHPVKRLRPIARGELGARAALAGAAALAGLAITLAVLLGARTSALLVSFLALQAAYSAGLKHVALVDVAAIAGLHVIRAAAGAAAVHVHISAWLLACTALLALFLALAKRRAELALVSVDATPGRPALDGYSAVLLDRLVTCLAAATVAAYVAYSLTGGNSRWMAVTIPFVCFGIGRYVLLLRRRGAGEEPEEVLLRDPPLLGGIGAWVGVCAAILVATH